MKQTRAAHVYIICSARRLTQGTTEEEEEEEDGGRVGVVHDHKDDFERLKKNRLACGHTQSPCCTHKAQHTERKKERRRQRRRRIVLLFKVKWID